MENCHPYKTKDFSQPDLEDPSESEFEEKAASRGPVEVCKEGRGIGAQSNNQKVKKKKNHLLSLGPILAQASLQYLE